MVKPRWRWQHGWVLDVVWAPVNGFCGIEDEPHELNEIYKDEWGVTYKKNGWPIIAQIDTPVKSREDWVKYKIPAVDTPGRLRILNDSIAANENNWQLQPDSLVLLQ